MRRSYLAAAIALIAFAFTSIALAVYPTYDGYLRWIEDQNPKDSTPAEKRIFIGFSNEWSAIIPYSDKLTIRSLIDKTKAKGMKVHVIILRKGVRSFAFDDIVGPTDEPAFQLKSRDVVALADPRAPNFDSEPSRLLRNPSMQPAGLAGESDGRCRKSPARVSALAMVSMW